MSRLSQVSSTAVTTTQYAWQATRPSIRTLDSAVRKVLIGAPCMDGAMERGGGGGGM